MGKRLIIPDADFSANCIKVQEGYSVSPNQTKEIRYGATGMSGNWASGVTWTGGTKITVTFNGDGYAEIPDTFKFDTTFAVGAFSVDDGTTTSAVVKAWNLSKLDMSKVKSFSYMFRANTELKQLIIPFDTSEATDFSHMFNGCSKLEELDLSTFKRTTADISNMFRYCNALKKISFGANFDFSSSLGSNVFEQAYSLVRIDAPSVTGADYQSSGTGAYNLVTALTGVGSTGTLVVNCSDGVLTYDKANQTWDFTAN